MPTIPINFGNGGSSKPSSTVTRDSQAYRNSQANYYAQLVENNPYKGTPYEALYLNNPYRESQYGELSFWDKLGNALGLRTQHDQYETDRKTAEAEYNAQLASLKQSNEYNSAEEQAQRMRDAGLNPAINGGVDAGDGGSMPMDETPPTAPTPTSPQEAFNSFMSAISLGLNFSDSIIAMKDKILTNQGKEIANANGILDNAEHTLLSTMTNFNFKEIDPELKYAIDDKGNKVEFSEIANVVQATAYDLNPYEKGSRNYNMYKKFARRLVNSSQFKAKYWQHVSDYLTNKTNAGIAANHPAYTDDESTEIVATAAKKFSDTLYKSLQSDYRANTANNNYMAKYYNNLNPLTRAQLENQQVTNMALEENMSNAMLKSVNGVITWLEGLMKNGSNLEKKFASGLLIGLYELKNRTITLPNVNFSKDIKNYNSTHTTNNQRVTNYNE